MNMVNARRHRMAQIAGSRGGMLGLAVTIGVGAGFGAVIFRWIIRTITIAFTGYPDYSSVGHAANPHIPALGIYFVVLTPIIAGILYGPLVYFFAREARGHGVPEVMVAVARQGGRIRPQVAIVKTLASALCIGGGGSVGREGPIVQIGAALGSTLAQTFGLNERRIKLLVACGAAGGIAATFNAPLAGVFFAMEIILRQWATESFGMVVLSSVTASVIGRVMLGNHPFLTLPAFQVDHLVQYPIFAIFGVIAGLVGVSFSRVLYAIEDLCDWAWRGPEWARPAVGGVFLGLLLLALPEMYGVGYPVLGNAVDGKYVFGFLILLLVGKMIACSLTIGIGGSGGVFAPSLFCGAMLGAAFGEVVHHIAPTAGGSTGAYALVGMGAVFAGATRAPITAIVILFELTGEYSIILPLMLTVTIATIISNSVSHDTIYTRKLLRRGIDIDEPADVKLRRQPASQFMSAPPEPVRVTDSLEVTARRFADSQANHLPVLDSAGRYLGVLSARSVITALAADEQTDVAALTTAPPAIHPSSPIGEVLKRLDRSGAVGVTDADDVLVGWILNRDVLNRLTSATD